MLKLFLSGFLQILLVSANVIFIANKLWICVAITAFFISFIWSYNVKKIVFGGIEERIAYSFGAALGAVSGAAAALTINQIFQYL